MATARFASPSTGGAVTRTPSTPASRQPVISSRAARGVTRSRTSELSAPAVVVVATGQEVAREHPLVLRERCPQILRELAPGPLDRLHLADDPRLLVARLLEDLLAGQPRLAQHQLDLALGVGLHLVGHALRVDERVLQRLLEVGSGARTLLERGQLLLEQ